jgi:hypothetical protein
VPAGFSVMPTKRDAKPGRQPTRKRLSTLPDPEWDKLSQREKFIRMAREVEADETGAALDEALRKIGKARQR